MVGERAGYRAYMLRLWLAGGNGELVWHASLESAHTGERLAFADLQALFAFLKQTVAEADIPPGLAFTVEE